MVENESQQANGSLYNQPVMDYFAKLRNARVATDSIPTLSYLRKCIDSQLVATRLNLAFLSIALLRLVLIILVCSVNLMASLRFIAPCEFVLFPRALVSAFFARFHGIGSHRLQAGCAMSARFAPLGWGRPARDLCEVRRHPYEVH